MLNEASLTFFFRFFYHHCSQHLHWFTVILLDFLQLFWVLEVIVKLFTPFDTQNVIAALLVCSYNLWQ